MNTTEIILLIVSGLFYVVGGLLASLLTGWETANTKDAFKIMFWPITIFICKS
jgi:hypothetical protein